MTDSTNSSIKMPIRRMNVDELDNNTTALFNTQRTNCITEIPQDIKLELLNGELKLLAGTKVYVPNGKNTDGSNKFDVVTITSDMQISPSGYASLKHILCALPNNRIQLLTLDTQQYSGSAAPSGQQYMFWYDTANNYVKYTADSGSTWQSGWCLPLAIVTIANGTGVTSIDQVFKGFGYIGSTAFALPGVKGLFPNGRNADGTLKTIEFVNPAVRIHNVSGTYSVKLCLATSGIGAYFYAYDEFKNAIYRTDTGAYYPADRLIVGDISYTNGVITSLQPKTTFHAVDYSDKPEISGWSMPGNVFIDLTLGTSGAEYTAQANGYVLFERGSTSGNKYINLYNNNSQLGVIGTTIAGVANARVFLPVKKGDIFRATYSADSTNPIFKLIYADGEI